MIQVKIDVQGLEGALAALEELTTDKILAAAAGGMAAGLQEIVGIAQGLVPVDSGDLRGSISADSVEVSGGGVTGRVKATAAHAGYVEMGTSTMPAKPFLYPALMQGAPAVEGAIAAAVKGVVGG